MEWLSEYDKTRRSSWTFVSFSGLTLLLKDELSFAVLYAECRVDGLSVDPEKVIDAAAFDFSRMRRSLSAASPNFLPARKE